MTKISITKAGFRAVRWDRGTGAFTSFEPAGYVSQLRCECSIDEGVTLADIFDAVDPDAGLKEFLRQYSWCDVDAFHAEARQPRTQPLNLPHLQYVEIAKHIEFDADEASETIDVSAIGEPYGEGHTRYGIELTAVNEIAPLPVRLNRVAEVRQDGKIIASAPATFTLLDVLGEIYFEISFYGSPADRDEMTADLLDKAADVNDIDPAPLSNIWKDTIH